MLAVGGQMFSMHKIFYFVHISRTYFNSLNKQCGRISLFSSKPLKFESKVPQRPYMPEILARSKDNSKEVEIDEAALKQIQRWSLVKLEDEKALNTLKEAVNFANRVLDIDTEGVEPLYTVHQDRNLQLRSDKVFEGDCREDILLNADVKEENYFVAPPGNVPLEIENTLPSKDKKAVDI